MSSNFDPVLKQIGTILLGKEQQVKLALSCLIAQGHLLIEDIPGMGKTTLAQSLAVVLGLDYERVQFTSDLLPSDIVGVSIYEPQKAEFTFHKGPVFTHVLLADEINRSTPKTQSALLEAMEEKQVTVDGNTRVLAAPFIVIATQNPLSQAGTYPLPESQLDRFLMCLSLGYPNADAELRLLGGENPRERLQSLKPLLNTEKVKALQEQVRGVDASDRLLEYILRLVHFTRTDDRFDFGLSPRGSLALLNASKAWALIHGRDYVKPEDVQAVLPSVVEHRVRGYGSSNMHFGEGADSHSQYLMRSVEVVER